MPAPKHELERLYIEEGLTTREIGERYGVAHITIRRWLGKYGIPVRVGGRGLASRGIVGPTRSELNQMIHVEGLTYRQVASRYGVDQSAIPHWLDRFGLPRKGRAPRASIEEVARRYRAGESAASIAQSLGYKSHNTILKQLDAAGIERREGGWKPERRLVSSAGCPVRSTYELRVADWLTAHGISFEYEPDVPFDKRCRGDFFANGWYIEVWGVHSIPSYAKQKKRKQEGYKRHGVPLIELSPHHFSQARHILERRLRLVLQTPESAGY